jgi:hypothetical protein
MTEKTRAKFEALWTSYAEARDSLAAFPAPDLPATAETFARFVLVDDNDRALKGHLALLNDARKALRRLIKHVHKHGPAVFEEPAQTAPAAAATASRSGPARNAPRKRRVTSLEPSVRTPVGARARKAALPASKTPASKTPPSKSPASNSPSGKSAARRGPGARAPATKSITAKPGGPAAATAKRAAPASKAIAGAPPSNAAPIGAAQKGEAGKADAKPAAKPPAGSAATRAPRRRSGKGPAKTS